MNTITLNELREKPDRTIEKLYQSRIPCLITGEENDTNRNRRKNI